MAYLNTTYINGKLAETEEGAQAKVDAAIAPVNTALDGIYTKKNLQTSGQASVHWGNLTGAPTSYTPSVHNHDDRYFTETELGSTTASSGASLVGVSSITGVTTGNVQTALASLKTLIDGKEATFSKNTAFNKNFGTGAGTVAEGNHTHTFASLTSKPTTLSGYGITDAATASHTHTFASLTSRPTTLAGYGITDAASATHSHTIAQVTGLQTALDNKEASFSKNSAFNKNFGTAAGTVAEGNHTHTWSQISGKPAEFMPAPHDHDGVYQSNIIDVICDTAAATAAKVITIPSYTLQNGDMFAIKFTLGSSVSTPTLNINGIGAKNIRLGSTNASTTTMTVGVNGVVLLYFDGDYFQLLGSHRTSDSVDETSMYHSVKKTMGAALYSYKMMAEGVDGLYYPFTLETGTGTAKTVSTAEYKLGGTILYYSTTTTIAAGATVASTYSSINHTRMNYTFNQSGGYELYRPIYLVGYLQGSDRFVLDNSTKTSFYTQTLPTTDDGKIYIALGQVYDTNSMRLTLTHTIYEFKDGELRQYVPTHAHNPTDVGLGNVDNVQQATKVEFDAHDTDSIRHITAAERTAWNAKTTLALGTTSSTAHRGDQGLVAYNHSQAAHAPSNAQKNSDITKAEIEAKLTGGITTHTHTFASLTSRPTTVSGFGITDAYTKTEVDTKVAGIVGSAPATLDTLNELAAALGNDANFATTVSNQIGLKANSADVYTKTNLQNSGQASIHFGNLTNLPTTYTPSVHNHDDRYYTETESDGRFVRTGTRTDNYLWMRRSSVDAASFFTQQGTGDIVRFHKGTGDGTLVSAIDNSGNFTGNAGTATKWLASRTITLAGDLSGTISIDGSADVTADISALRIKTTDNRTVKPKDTIKNAFDTYFTNTSALGTGGSGYSDLLVMNGWTNTSGGKLNAIEFDKNTMVLRHYQTDQDATSWGTPKTIAYTSDIAWGNLSDIPSATTSVKGIVQLSSSTSSTSTTLAATASAVKAAYDLANGRETTGGAQSKADAAEANAINWAKAYGLGAEAKDITGQNLNTLVGSGFYQGTQLVNNPENNSGGRYLVINVDQTTYQMQIASRAVNNTTFIRSKTSASAWGEWQELETVAGAQAKIDAVNAANVSKAGDTMTGALEISSNSNSQLIIKNPTINQTDANGPAIQLIEGTEFGKSGGYGMRFVYEGTANKIKFQGSNQTAVSTIFTAGRDDQSINFHGNITVDGTLTGNGSGLTSLNASNFTTGTLPDARIANASTSAKGTVQLSTSTSSTSTTLAATASAVKAAYDLANHGHPYLSDSATSQQVISGSEVNVRSTTTNNAFKIEFNENEQSLDFIFS